MGEHDRSNIETDAAGRWRPVLRALPSFVFVVALTLLLSPFSVFHRLERPIADWQAKYFGPARDSDVIVIDITDQDYETMFRAQSPLGVHELELVLQRIADTDAAVIGVDIDTSDPRFADLKLPSKAHFVWAQEAGPVQRTENQVEYQPLDVLGGRGLEANRDSGLPVLIVDPHDHVTRTYTRMIETRDGLLPTFSWAVVERYRQVQSGVDKKVSDCAPNHALDQVCTDARAIRYTAKRDRHGCFYFRVSQAFGPCGAEHDDARPWTGKIVLLGGSYTDAEKNKLTPVGIMSGVEVLANVVETELEGGGPREPGALFELIMELFEGLILVALFQVFGLRKATLASIAVIPIIAWVCGMLSGRSFVFFVPILLAVLCFEWFMHYRERLFSRLVHRWQRH